MNKHRQIKALRRELADLVESRRQSLITAETCSEPLVRDLNANHALRAERRAVIIDRRIQALSRG